MSEPASPLARPDLPGSPNTRQRGRRQGALLWAGVALSLLLAAPFGSHFAALAGECPVKSLFGVPCPTCGTTRSALALAQFQFAEAFIRFPLPTLVWILFIAGGLTAGAWALSRHPLPGLPRALPWSLKVLLVVVVLANWAYSWHTGI